MSEPLHVYRARFLQQLITEGTADYWDRRADEWRSIAPRPGDYPGRATPDQLAQQRTRCLEVATQCHRHAELIRSSNPENHVDPLVWDALAEAMGPGANRAN